MANGVSQTDEARDATRIRGRRSATLPSRTFGLARNYFGSRTSSTLRERTFHNTKATQHKMSDTEMDGGVALNGASPTHSQLAERINSGAMDVKSPSMNGAASIAESTIAGRL
jgi:hypothetical protein